MTQTQGLIYNMANQITSSGYAYDPAGNLKQDSNFKYTYDAWNRLVEVNKAYDNSLVAGYTYDGQCSGPAKLGSPSVRASGDCGSVFVGRLAGLCGARKVD